jgi:signal transduction histidine kinase
VRESAERDCSAPPGLTRSSCFAGAQAARAEAVARLAWLAPGAASLVALARAPAEGLWPRLSRDPGAVLLLARRVAALAPDAPPSRVSFSAPALLTDAGLIEEALRLLDGPAAGFVDWTAPGVRTVYDAALAVAGRARELAVRGGVCDPETAWVCGLLAPLGWLALCATDPERVAACLADAELPHAPLAVQRRVWGLDHAAIARRVARRWHLPGWLAAVAADLDLPAAVACGRGADPILFRLARLAVAGTAGAGLHLAADVSTFTEEDRTVLGLTSEVCAATEGAGAEDPAPAQAWQDPHGVPLLRDLLGAAAENRRLRARVLHTRLEDEVDHLHRALGSQAREQERRVRDGRLEALAEFAAGAGHEINNPLAVISGQAQYLLGHAGEWFDPEAAPAATASLDAIVVQARRIHGLLRELMVFARPAPPAHSCFDLPGLLGEVAASLEGLAVQRRVRVEVAARPDRLAVCADASQVRQALACLLRNAIEAAGPGGWARLLLRDEPAADLAIVVEDSGPGPDVTRQQALFDPFFSGRWAGRGRGLGLPVAWRLARQQGGDVRLEPRRPGEPTRFILSLPRPPEVPVAGPEIAPLPTAAVGPANGVAITPLAG